MGLCFIINMEYFCYFKYNAHEGKIHFTGFFFGLQMENFGDNGRLMKKAGLLACFFKLNRKRFIL
jgi:hypothetical protein